MPLIIVILLVLVLAQQCDTHQLLTNERCGTADAQYNSQTDTCTVETNQ